MEKNKKENQIFNSVSEIEKELFPNLYRSKNEKQNIEKSVECVISKDVQKILSSGLTYKI
jgi:hypothetical protein